MGKKIIIITGITKGLGYAMFREFCKENVVVCGCGRDQKEIIKLQNEYPEHNFQVVDIIDYRTVKKWAGNIIDLYGAPDIVINNAALINKKDFLWNIPTEEFSSVIDVNIKGIMYVIKYFIPAMIQVQKGIVVNFSSGWGKFTAPQVAPYCASKFAVEGLTQSLAQELPQGLAAVALSPGIINTDMLKKVFGKNAESYKTPELWARKAIPFILNLSEKDNGKSLEIV